MQPLLDNQNTAISKLNCFKVGALFMDQGTGKSRTALELVRSVPDIDYVLHLAPFRSVNPKVQGTGIQSEIAKWGGYGVETEFVGIESISASGRIYLFTADGRNTYIRAHEENDGIFSCSDVDRFVYYIELSNEN
jgi:hypothetical protein